MTDPRRNDFPCTEIRDIAVECREFLEQIWPTWHAERNVAPPVLSMWTCSRSSLFLQRVLNQQYGLPALWMTGCPFDAQGNSSPAGFYDGAAWRGHSWVVSDNVIVDITADQFGLDPVVILPFDDPRYQSSIDLALPEFKRKRIETLEATWPLWLAVQPPCSHDRQPC